MKPTPQNGWTAEDGYEPTWEDVRRYLEWQLKVCKTVDAFAKDFDCIIKMHEKMIAVIPSEIDNG